MFLTIKNIFRHLLIIIFSFVVLLPAVWLSNKSYYTSISKVNYWEEKQIVGLISYALKYSDQYNIQNNLNNSISDINFFDITISKNNNIILHKKLVKYKIDLASTKSYKVNDFDIRIAKRMYNTSLEDYYRYIKVIFTDIGKLFVHQYLVIFIIHLNILLIFELFIVYLSINYRFKRLRRSIDNYQSL